MVKYVNKSIRRRQVGDPDLSGVGRGGGVKISLLPNYVAYARLYLPLILFKDDKLLQLFRLGSEKW